MAVDVIIRMGNQPHWAIREGEMTYNLDAIVRIVRAEGVVVESCFVLGSVTYQSRRDHGIVRVNARALDGSGGHAWSSYPLTNVDHVVALRTLVHMCMKEFDWETHVRQQYLRHQHQLRRIH